MNVFKKTLMMLTLGVGSLFIGASAADAQWGYRSYGYAPRYYNNYNYGSYYGSPYGYRSYSTPYYGGGYRSYGYQPYGNYYGGSGVYIVRGGIGIGF